MECIDFQRLRQIFASFTRENLGTREAEVSSLTCGRKQKKTLLWLDAGMANVPGATKTCADPQCCCR